MKNVIVVTTVLLLVNAASRIDAQNGNLQQLSYGGELLPAYKPPTTSTTTTTEAPTTKSSFFGGIKNWFKKNPSTETPPEITPSTATTGRSTATSSSNSPSNPTDSSKQPLQDNAGRRDYINPNLPTSTSSSPSSPKPSASNIPQSSASTPSNRRDYANPNIPSSLPSQVTPSSPSVFQQSQTPTSPSNRRDYVNPNLPSSVTSSPSNAPQTPSTPLNRRDYVNPNVVPSKPPQAKEDFPALPPPRSSSSQPSTPTSPSGSVPSAWNNRPGSPQQQPGSPIGANGQSAWSARPSDPSSPTPKPSMVSFVPTTRPAGVRPGATAKPTPPPLASDNELIELSENLLSKDVNNLNKYITLNLQGKTKSYVNTDEAPNPLIQIDSKAFDVPTVAKMKLMFNNYELDASVHEYVTPIEKKEENDFIDAVLATSVMRQAMQFLQQKGKVTPDPKSHRDLLKEIWFALYSRGQGRIGSSGFEHIFLSEVKNGTVVGLHNALYFHEEEQKGHIDYKGYLKTLDFGSKGSIVKYRFEMNGISKPVNAMFVGPSPELELALYTVCFEVRADHDCPVSLNGSRFNIPTYTYRYRGKRLVGSGFPEI